MTRTDEALSLAREIFALETQLLEKKDVLARLVGDVASNPVSAPMQSDRPRAFLTKGQTKPGSVADKIKTLLAANPTKTFEMSEIVASMPGVKGQHVRGAASRIARDRLSGVKQIKRGRYRFAAPNGTGDSMTAHSVLRPSGGG